MRRIETKSLVLGIVLGVVACVGVAATPKAASERKEYKIFTAALGNQHLENAVNKAADEGWDLVSCNQWSGAHMVAVMARVKEQRGDAK